MIALLSVLLAFAQDDARQQAAEQQFDSVMMQNAVNPKMKALGYVNGAPATTLPAPRPTLPAEPPDTSDGGTVEVPLPRYEAVRTQIAEASAEAEKSYATLVVLGASTWTGRAEAGGLAMHLSLQATLLGPGFWKAVPVIGEEVAVVSAKVGGAPITFTNQNGYQVWLTDQVGEVTLELDVLVPARGPRGSLEYDFLVARTPVTRFDCTFAEPGLEPRLERTVRAETLAEGGGTRLSAWLTPTSRIHLVGFKDLGDEDGRAARVYVETVSLLSVEETTADLFTVLRYDILQSGTRTFDILVPPGLTVVSAEGDGAFRYTLEPDAEGVVLHGETAFPIRDAYEVSLRLSRTLDGIEVDVVPPRALHVEREHGWLGVEALGTVQIQELGREEALAVDVAQLPVELVGNAVSPVLYGWRYHTANAHVRLGATRLPEREPVAGAIDEVVAVTTISAEGRARTELRITLRNRLRHSLALRLPDGVEVRSSQLDGEAITPSKATDGTVLFPLKRSPGERPAPFTLQLVLEGDVGAIGLFGAPSLALPAVGLPVSTLRWDVRVPAPYRYTRLYGDIGPQGTAGEVHVDAPSDQATLRYQRFWVAADQPVRVRFGYLRGWLQTPLALLGAGLLGMLAVSARRAGVLSAPRVAGALLLGAAALGWGGGAGTVLVAAVGAAWVTGDLRAALDRGRGWLASARTSPEGPPPPGSWRARGFFGRTLLVATSGFVLLILVIEGVRLMTVLGNPL